MRTPVSALCKQMLLTQTSLDVQAEGLKINPAGILNFWLRPQEMCICVSLCAWSSMPSLNKSGFWVKTSSALFAVLDSIQCNFIRQWQPMPYERSNLNQEIGVDYRVITEGASQSKVLVSVALHLTVLRSPASLMRYIITTTSLCHSCNQQSLISLLSSNPQCNVLHYTNLNKSTKEQRNRLFLYHILTYKKGISPFSPFKTNISLSCILEVFPTT